MSSNITSLCKSKAVQLFADRTRRADLDTADFAQAYVQLGACLGIALVEQLEMEDYDIPHCQGMRKGVRIKDEKAIGIIVMLRAGLYLAEGLRELLRTSPMFLVEPKRGSGISEADLAKISLAKLRHALIVDAVVNTGASITPIFGQLKGIGIRGITVVAGVAPKEKAECLAADNLDINFLFARLSTNTYVGKGGTDTGNRLFGTEFLD